MSFAERVLITIETKVDNAKSGIAGFRQSVAQAEGATGKLKAAASGVGSAMSSALGAITSPAGLAAAGGAVVAFAAKSVGAFEELGTTVGKFSDATGTTAEDASRLVEVFSDLGIAPDAASASIGKMEKTLIDNSKALEKWGISAVKASDGTTDVTATFLQAVDTISKIKDPTEQAAAAQATFGKSWQSMAEVIKGGAPALKAAMDAVQSSKVLDSQDVANARALRDGLDHLRDAGEGLALTFGKALAPAITQLANRLGDVVSQAEPAFKAFGDGIASTLEDIGPLITLTGKLAGALGDMQTAANKSSGERSWLDTIKRSAIDSINPLESAKHHIQDMTDEFGSNAELSGKMADGLFGVTEGATAVSAQVETTAEKTKRLADETKATTDALKAQADALKADLDALNAVSDGYASAADNQIGYNKALDEFGKKATDSKASADDIRDSAIGASKAHAELYTSLIEASGGAATATGKLDAQNETLLATAKLAGGPARQSILDYTFALNGIPPEKRTDIIAALNRGDVDEAKRLLDEASRNRTATVKADADNASLNQTNREIDNVARDRTATVYFQPSGFTQGVNSPFAKPGTTKSGLSVNALAGAVTAPVMYTTNVTNNVTVPRIPSGRELARVAERWSRVDGRR